MGSTFLTTRPTHNAPATTIAAVSSSGTLERAGRAVQSTMTMGLNALPVFEKKFWVEPRLATVLESTTSTQW